MTKQIKAFVEANKIVSEQSKKLDKVFTEALNDAVLYGHGFIRITNNNGLEAQHIKISEFGIITELFDWIKNNKYYEVEEKNG